MVPCLGLPQVGPTAAAAGLMRQVETLAADARRLQEVAHACDASLTLFFSL